MDTAGIPKRSFGKAQMHSAVTLAIVHVGWVKGTAMITEIPNNVIKMYEDDAWMVALWLWVVVDHGFVSKRNVCVCHVIYIYRRTECVYVITHACWYVVVCSSVPPPAVPGATSVRKITSAGWVAVWSSTLWYELWVIAGGTAHRECYSAKMPSWRSNASSFQAMYRPDVRSTGTRVYDLQ